MDSLKVTDAASQAVATAPRVALADIEAAIGHRFDIGGSSLFQVLRLDSLKDGGDGSPPTRQVVECLKIFSICLLVMRNGFVVVGKSAPASPANYDAELGKQFAYEDAVRQLWPLMGYALKDRLAVNDLRND